MAKLSNETMDPSLDEAPKRRPEAPGRGPGPPLQREPPGSREDQELFREMMDRFTVLAESCARFSQEVYRRSGTPIEADVEGTVRRNVSIARTVFSKWSLEILAVAYLHKSITYRDLQRILDGVSSRVLTQKLRTLERAGLVHREGPKKGVTEDRFYLTHKGLMITRLGEPVFLYIRLADGWREAGEASQARGQAVEVRVPAPMGQA